MPPIDGAPGAGRGRKASDCPRTRGFGGESRLSTMSAQSQQPTDPDVPHDRYEESNRKSYDSQQDVADAWAEGAFPTHNVDSGGEAVLYTGSPGGSRFGRTDDADGRRTNFYGEQRPSGAGTLWHYSTREAIRTKGGLILSNEQCWSTGFAHCSTPHGEVDATVPLSAVERFLDDDDTVHDISRVVTDSDSRGKIVVLDTVDHYGIAIGRDSSARRGTMPFAFRVNPTEIRRAEAEGVDKAINFMLRPRAVAESDLRVVDSSEYRKSRLDDDELAAHKAAGGRTTMVESWRGTEERNPQHFRADLRGECIVRQGEWFFAPDPDADPREQGTLDAEDELGSHRAQRQGGARKPVPTECGACGAASLDMDTDGGVACSECGAPQPRPVYVRGQIRHVDGDHNSINLGDVWHRAVTHGREVLTYDRNPTAGGRRRGGFD